MNIFLDTSSLFKLYHHEQGTEATENVFTENTVYTAFVSDISKVEFSSAVWKKVRTGAIIREQAEQLISALEADSDKYTFININETILEAALALIARYGINGLRTLDAIQLATATFLKDRCDLYLSADDLLNDLFRTEGLKTL